MSPILDIMLPPMVSYSGIGLRSPHYQQVLTTLPAVNWWEVHSENFFSNGGITQHVLTKIREHYPVSFHGVGLSLGSASPLNAEHLSSLKQLVKRFDPMLVSEHISWSSIDSITANDLLPLPYTEESLAITARHITQLQDTLQRQVLVENPSSYLQFTSSTIPEWEFMAEISKRSGCALLLDINNIYVSSCNHGYDSSLYLEALPQEAVKEIHLAGHARQEVEGQILLLDDHGTAVCPEVWALYRQAIRRCGPMPTLIEWDTNIPPLDILEQHAAMADRIMEECCATA
jgi:uncharacterized protein (UPF0276 family)